MRESLNPPPKREKIGAELRRAARTFSPRLRGEMSQRDRGGRPRAGRRCARTPAARAHPPSAYGISPPWEGENSEPNDELRSKIFLPPLAGGDVATRQKGAARAQDDGVRVRPRRGHTPPLPGGISPPRGGENSEPNDEPRSKISLPASGGRCRNATEGGRPRTGRRCARTPALRAYPPSVWRHLPPKGGEKIESRLHLPQGGENSEPSAQNGDVTPGRSPARLLSRPLRSDRRFAPVW